ncbi:MAG: hypothetical protein Q9160_003266 [Pyrenula sp. 1 TL-2023]
MLRQVWHNLSRRQFQLSVKQNPQKTGRRYNSSTPSNSPQKKHEGPQVPQSSDSAVTDKNPSKTVIWHQRLGPVSRFITWFDRTQAKRPLVTQLCTSLCVYLAGDVLAQNIGKEPYDLKRTSRHLTIGAIASIPGYHWFMFLGSHFNYSSRVLSILVKVVVQQITFTPIFNTYFFGMQSLLSGAGLRGAADRVRAAVPESIVNSIKVWPAVTALNFTFILPQYRFMFAGGVACLWQSYLSWLNQREVQLTRLEKGEKNTVGGSV